MSKHQTQTLPVVGMHCASCAHTIKRKIEKLAGVESCEVNFGTEKAKITFDPNKVTVHQMNSQINKLGYSLHSTHNQEVHRLHDGHDMMTPITSDKSVKEKKLAELAKLKNHVMIMIPFVAVSVLVMGWEIGAEPLKFWPEMPEIAMVFFHHLLPILATYTLFVIGLQYLKGMMRFFRYGAANMDSLVGLGTFVAFGYSFFISAFEKALAPYIDTTLTYYDVTIVVIGFITIGKYLEVRSKLKTGAAIEKLIGLQAKSAIVLRDGQHIELPLEKVVVGDTVIVKPGQKIPVDGIIIEGSTSIDESMISGESLPVDKNVHDTVIGSTINKQGSLKMKATQVGSDTMLAQIIKMVEEAQGSKAPIEKLADQISAIFVPLVLVISIVVFIFWLIFGSFTLAMISFVGILVIACPCAMGLATPTAVIVGVGKAAENGILIKNAENLERFTKINFVVLDKTGTITKGQPEVTDIEVTGSVTEKEVLDILGSIEQHSEHPLGQAIVTKAKETSSTFFEVRDFSNIEGKGVKATIEGVQYFAGNLSLIGDLNLEPNNTVIQKFSSQGKTPIILMTKNSILAYVGLADTIKEHAKKTIDKLHTYGLKVAMLTGDHQQTAEYIAKQVGVDKVIAEVLPSQKASEVQKLQKAGYKVAMVGDGINDAPALATADVGVAMGTGTDVAIESAGITLLGGEISKLPKAFQLSRSTMRTIKQNLFWAFFYNVISIPIAAGLLYPLLGILLNPAIAGAAMAFSSVSVVLNALRLKTVKL